MAVPPLPPFPPAWEPWLCEDETWVYDVDILDVEKVRQPNPKRLFQNCTTFFDDYITEPYIRDLARQPIARWLTNRPDGWRDANAGMQDLDFRRFKQDMIRPKIKLGEGQQFLCARVEGPQRFPDCWKVLAAGSEEELEQSWLDVFRQGIANGVKDHCFRFRIVWSGDLTTYTFDLPSEPDLAADPQTVMLLDCALRLLHWDFVPVARERVRMRELAGSRFLGQYGLFGNPPAGVDMRLEDLDFVKWRDEVLKRVESATQRVERIEYLHPPSLAGKGKMTWHRLILDDEQGWWDAMKLLYDWCKHPQRRWFIFRLLTAEIPKDAAQDAPKLGSFQVGGGATEGQGDGSDSFGSGNGSLLGGGSGGGSGGGGSGGARPGTTRSLPGGRNGTLSGGRGAGPGDASTTTGSSSGTTGRGLSKKPGAGPGKPLGTTGTSSNVGRRGSPSNPGTPYVSSSKGIGATSGNSTTKNVFSNAASSGLRDDMTAIVGKPPPDFIWGTRTAPNTADGPEWRAPVRAPNERTTRPNVALTSGTMVGSLKREVSSGNEGSTNKRPKITPDSNPLDEKPPYVPEEKPDMVEK
jgi:hypothetical protein